MTEELDLDLRSARAALAAAGLDIPEDECELVVANYSVLQRRTELLLATVEVEGAPDE